MINRSIPDHVPTVVRDVAKMLREQRREAVFDDLVLEVGFEFAVETIRDAQAFNTSRS